MDFDSFYKEYYSKIYSFCLRWTGSPADAKDIVQESFTEFFEKLSTQELINNPSAWVYRVAYNRCANQTKRKKRFSFTNIENVHTISNDEEWQINKERYQKVRVAMDKLNEKEKAIVILYKEQFTYKEIAKVVEMNEKSVGKTLSRAIDKMAKWLN